MAFAKKNNKDGFQPIRFNVRDWLYLGVKKIKPTRQLIFWTKNTQFCSKLF
jgi:hypothetical protein